MRLGWQTVFVGYRSDDVIYWRRSMAILDSNFGVRLRNGFWVVEEKRCWVGNGYSTGGVRTSRAKVRNRRRRVWIRKCWFCIWRLGLRFRYRLWFLKHRWRWLD